MKLNKTYGLIVILINSFMVNIPRKLRLKFSDKKLNNLNGKFYKRVYVILFYEKLNFIEIVKNDLLVLFNCMIFICELFVHISRSLAEYLLPKLGKICTVVFVKSDLLCNFEHWVSLYMRSIEMRRRTITC